MRRHGFWKYLWVAFSLINSGFSYFWDIERDWDIQWFTASTGQPPDQGCRCAIARDMLRTCVSWWVLHALRA